MRYVGKAVECAGVLLAVLALAAGLGLTSEGRPGLTGEIGLLAAAAVVFGLGCWLETMGAERE